MRLGLYIFASLALIGLIAGFAYTVNPGNYVYEIAGINLNFPIALWIAIPMLLLLVMTIFHMIYHSTKNFFARRKWIRDANELQDALYWSVLKEPKAHHFSIPEIKCGAALLSVSSLDVLDSTEGLSDKLGKTINWVKKIQDGEYIDLKEKKVVKFLSRGNPIVVQNTLNRLQSHPEFAETVLMSKETYSPEAVSSALALLVEKETLFKIRKFSSMLDGKSLTILLERADAGEDVGLTADNLDYITQNVELKCTEYMRLARTTLKKLTPDENLSLFKKLAAEKEAAENAYLYLLFQYEMLDDVKAYLEECEEEEFKPFRALYILKKGKYNYSVSDIISSANVCNED
jgi:ABC-type multidrug transport system fused ATPase/permease subunit